MEISTIKYSIITPAFNEQVAVRGVVLGLADFLEKNISDKYEIIVINDGSTDETGNILRSLDVKNYRYYSHPYNKGYGASLKLGAEKAQGEYLIFFDSDGQHKPEYIREFLKYEGDYDLIAGDRSGSKYIRPVARRHGLWLLNKIANYLVDFKIPDLNCGLRLVKKDALINYLHFMPDGFSFSTTSTLAFLKDKKNVKFVPIEVNKRSEGTKSFVRPRDAITTLMLIFRLIMLFSPLRIFLPASFILFFFGMISLVYDLFAVNITDFTIFLTISSLILFFFGLIADQVASLRRDINRISKG